MLSLMVGIYLSLHSDIDNSDNEGEHREAAHDEANQTVSHQDPPVRGAHSDPDERYVERPSFGSPAVRFYA